ncbi:uncharacterized protein LOC144118430 [Amblyomma americanum]
MTPRILRWSLLLWMLEGESLVLAYKCTEVTDAVFDRASECVVKVMHPAMIEAFQKSESSASSASGMPDLQRVKQEWNKSCTAQDNSITRLLVPSQSDDNKVRMTYMVETCLNSSIFTTQFEESLLPTTE